MYDVVVTVILKINKLKYNISTLKRQNDLKHFLSW